VTGRFPSGFLWGTATSAHQVEGGNDANDWWEWEQKPGHIHDGSRSGDACGWWAGRAEEDLSLGAAHGQTAHRLSLEWSRLEPEPGRFDDRAFARYAAILAHARAAGLSILVTLNHYTLPRWAARRGAWLAPTLATSFARYAGECARRLGDRVDLWATFNELSVIVVMGYVGTAWPPGVGELSAGQRAFVHLLEAHAGAYRTVHEARPGAQVGIVLNAPFFAPARPGSLADRAVAATQDWVFTGALLHALATGRLLPPLALIPREIRGLRRSVDFLGLNYYGRYDVRFDPAARDRAFGRHVQTPSVHTDNIDWGKPHPAGLAAQLARLARLGVPLYVTENGVCDGADAMRPEFLITHVSAVHGALRAGVDVRGYFHWSLVDNFEWAEGYAPRFGLVAVDRATARRTPRPSAAVYAAICRANGLDDPAR
jgi:beta-glucosidase